jgi:hypothetical protein
MSNPAEREAGRIAYLYRELVIASRNYRDRSELVSHDPESELAANRLGELLNEADLLDGAYMAQGGVR